MDHKGKLIQYVRVVVCVSCCYQDCLNISCRVLTSWIAVDIVGLQPIGWTMTTCGI